MSKVIQRASWRPILPALALASVLSLVLYKPQPVRADTGLDPVSGLKKGLNRSGHDALLDQACSNDPYEPDDNFTQAQNITTDGIQQSHINTPGNEEDWVKFTAVAGHQYEIRTRLTNDINQSDTAANDTLLYLYATDGVTQLAFNDDVGNTNWYLGNYYYRESIISWTAPAIGVYYVRELQWGPTAGYTIRDCHTYNLWVVDLTNTPMLTLTKTSTTASVTAAGQVVNYSYLLSNTTNVTLTGIVLSDNNTISPPGCPQNILMVGDSITCTASHMVTQAEMDIGGNLTNIATAGSDQSSPITFTLNIPINQSPTLTVVKSSTTSSISAPGVVNYSYLVTNTGNVTVTGISASDNNIDAIPGMSCPSATLAVGTNMSCSAQHTVTQAEINAGGNLTNTVTVTSSAPTVTNTLNIPINQSPALTVTKTLTNVVFDNPQVVHLTYSIILNDTGNVDLHNVQVVDDLLAAFPAPATYTLTGGGVFSSNFTVNSGYNGSTDMNLLQYTPSNPNTLNIGATGTITLTVQADTGGTGTIYTNTSVASGVSPSDQTVGSTSSAAGPSFIDPALTKTVDPSHAAVGDTVTFTIIVSNHGTDPATGVIVTDPVPGNLDILSTSSVDDNTLLPRGTITLLPPNTVQVNIGLLDITDRIVITIVTKVNGPGLPPVQNQASVVADPPEQGVSPDPLQNNSSAVVLQIDNPQINALSSVFAARLPATGFAPGRATLLAPQPLDEQYTAQEGLWLEIPSLGVSMPIVGIPRSTDGWDVTWLSSQAGWLQGTAFPSRAGSSVLTGHVYLSNGLPGPFVNLSQLRYGDDVIVHAFGERFIYEVRESLTVAPDDVSIIKHEDLPWVTLITCRGYDEARNVYLHRMVIRAVLVSEVEDLAGGSSGGRR